MTKSRSVCREFPNVTRYLEEKLFRRRKKLKLSQMALAERAGLTRNCIQQLECYEHLPLPSTMFRLIRALEFSEKKPLNFGSRSTWPMIGTRRCRKPYSNNR